MTIMLADIQNKPKAEPSQELLELRGDLSKDKPYWADQYTPEEWQARKWFEKKSSDEDTYSGCIGLGDLSEFDV